MDWFDVLGVAAGLVLGLGFFVVAIALLIA